MTTPEEKLKAIQTYLKKTRKALDRAVKNDCEYTAMGNGINCCEASNMFKEVETEIGQILKS